MTELTRITDKAELKGLTCVHKRGLDWRHFVCSKPAKVIENGLPYCGICDPERGRKRRKKLAERMEMEDKARKQRNAEHEERLRRADRYPEAIRLIEAWSQGLSGENEFISSKRLNEWTKAFLAEEPKP